MKEPKRYSCGNGEGMFEDDKNGHWVEYSEHKAIVDALTKQSSNHDVTGRIEQFVCADCINGRDAFDPDWLCPKCRLKKRQTDYH